MHESATRQAGDRRRTKEWNGATVRDAFALASQTKPWTLGYRSIESDRISGEAEVTGALPPDLRGTLFRNGPARHERGGERYGHRWDGDGMIQRFDLSDRGVTHVGQYVHTQKYDAEARSDRFLVSAFGTHVPGSDSVPKEIDQVNPANISVLHVGGELLALWEAGSAHRLDADTLATRGIKTWDASVAGRPFSAHPRIEANGTLWNFGADPLTDELTIYRIDRDGRLIESRVIHVDQLPPTHDFAITENHLVFLFPSFKLNKERLLAGASFAEACQWSPSSGMRAMTVDKRDWSQRFFDLPPGCLFHVANAWEDHAGTVRVEYMRSDEPISLLAGWSVMKGEYRHFEGARLTTLALDPVSGSAKQTTIGENESEFPIVAASDVSRPYENVLCIERGRDRHPDLPGFDQVAMINVQTGQRQHYTYGSEWLVEEHLLISGQGSVAPRWVVGTALDLRHSNTVLSVFDAGHLENGPMAQGRLPYALPFGLHGTFRFHRS